MLKRTTLLVCALAMAAPSLWAQANPRGEAKATLERAGGFLRRALGS